jgi:hypothetical protein
VDSVQTPPGELLEWSAEQYFADTDRVSRSMLDKLRESPRTYHARFIAKTAIDSPESPAMRLGSLVHAKLLEDASGYAVAPRCDRRTNAGKEAFAAFEAENAGRLVITEAMNAGAEACCEALRRNTIAASIVAEPGDTEVSIGWKHGATGLDLKARLDRVVRPRSLVWDLKTTKDPSPDEFARSVVKFGYHRQQYMYQAAAESIGICGPFLFVCVRNCPPYDVAIYTLDDDAVELGSRQVEKLLVELRRRLDENDWAADYEKRLTELRLPAWALTDLEATS